MIVLRLVSSDVDENPAAILHRLPVLSFAWWDYYAALYSACHSLRGIRDSLVAAFDAETSKAIPRANL